MAAGNVAVATGAGVGSSITAAVTWVGDGVSVKVGSRVRVGAAAGPAGWPPQAKIRIKPINSRAFLGSPRARVGSDVNLNSNELKLIPFRIWNVEYPNVGDKVLF